ncbi:MAG: DUF3267 domain-containing protein [Ktedonobacterales bacterium]
MSEMTSAEPETEPGSLPATLRLVARLVSPRRRGRIADALRERRLRTVDALDLLAEETLLKLARHSLWLLAGSGVAFAGLSVVARVAHGSGPLLGAGSPALRGAVLVLANAASYAGMLPIHEGLHAAAMLALGGRPRFGLKLPLAAYCTAPGQLFTRNGYLAIAAAPLVVLTVAGAVITWLAPDLGACILFGLAGNVSGAVGDLWAIARIRRLPSSALLEDTATGFTVYAVP